jgi:hypothetical protein
MASTPKQPERPTSACARRRGNSQCDHRTLTLRSLFMGALIVLAACSDSPTAPVPSIDRVAAARVMPSVVDARIRIAGGIMNTIVRDRVVHDLHELEVALANGDGQKARFHVRTIGDVLSEYRKQQGSTTTDGAEVSAITLMLNQVSSVVGSSFDIAAFP